MTTPQQYPKPCMTNMPRDVGLQIFNEILSSSPPDPVKMKRELDEFERRIEEERRRFEFGKKTCCVAVLSK